jgi:hypothetical protein
MCRLGDHVICRVWVCADDSHTGEGRWADKDVDACLANQVRALNAAGRLTRSCCCGHGNGGGTIILHDGTRIPVGET